jgi:hypothetical protein
MSGNGIQNFLYIEENVGKTFKKTKKHYTWEFTIDGIRHSVELFDSKMSGKKRILLDRSMIKEVYDPMFVLNHSFNIGQHSLALIQLGEKYEIRLNNQSFGYLMDLEKNKIHFNQGKYTNEPVSTTIRNSANEGKIVFGISNYSKEK